MPWLLNRTGQQHYEGPYEDTQLLELIRSGQLRDGFITEPGTANWRPLHHHPPFAQALGGAPAGRKKSGTMVMSQDSLGSAPGVEQPAEAQNSSWSGMAGPAAPAGVSSAYSAGPGVAPPGAPQSAAVSPGFSPGPGGYAPGQPMPGQPMPGQPAGAYPGPAADAAPGAPPPGWGGVPGQPPAMSPGVGRNKPTKKRGGGVWIGIAAILLLTVVGAAVVLFLLGSGKSRLSAFVPDDVAVFVEVPNSIHWIRTALDIDFLDTSQVDADRHLDEAVQAMQRAFEIDKEDAEQFFFGIESLGMVMRSPSEKEQVVTLIGFRNAGSVQKLLESARFTKEGKFGTSGERHFLARGKLEQAADLGGPWKGLVFLQVTKESQREAMVWFEDAKLLAYGDPDLLDDIDSVITKGDGALRDSDAFSSADFSSENAMIGYVNSDLLDEVKGDEARKIVRGYFQDIKPFAADMNFVDAGILLRVRGQLKGDRISSEQVLPNPVEVTLHQKLPIGTVGYFAVASEKQDDGKTIKNQILKELRSNDESAARQFEATLQQIETASGLSFEQWIDGVGNELLLALVVDPEFKLDPTRQPDAYFTQGALVLLVQVGAQDAAETIVKELRRKMFEEGSLKLSYDVKAQGAGFQGLPKDPKLPAVQAFFHDDVLMLGIGGKPALARSLLALGGKEALSGDAAHQSAVSALSKKPRGLFWLDAGRVGQVLLDAAPEAARTQLDKFEKELGVSHRAIRLTGEQRITCAIGVYAESQGESWDYALESLNASSLAVFAGVQAFLGAGAVPPEPDLPGTPVTGTVPGLVLPETGVPTCDGLILMMQQCAQRTGNSGLATVAETRRNQLKAEIAASPAGKETVASRCTQELVQFTLSNPACSQ